MHYNISVDGYKGFRYLNNIETTRSKAIERLSSGYRINHTSDDAAGASMSTTLRTQIRGLVQASRNSEDMINLLNTAESGINAMTEMLQRIRELSVRAASDTNTTEERMYMQEEVNQLLKEVDRVSKDTEFNGITLFNNDPDVVRKAGGLAAVLGPDHITPNGKFSESYNLWDMVDKPPKKGGNAPNATHSLYYEVSVVTYTKYTSCSSEYIYRNFAMAGSGYMGSLFDSLGNSIGIIEPSGQLTLNSIGETLLPAKEDNRPDYTTDPVTKPLPYNFTYWPDGTEVIGSEQSHSSISVYHSFSAGNSAVYGKDVSGKLIPLSYNAQEIITGTAKVHSIYKDAEKNHIAASIDFEQFNKAGGYTKSSLYDKGFNSTCATCHRHFSIKFVQGAEPPTTSVLETGPGRDDRHLTLNIGIDVLNDSSTGEDLAKLVVDAIQSCEGGEANDFATHNTQYAYSGAKLYIFDRRVNPALRWDTFEAEVYGEPVKVVSREPLIHAQVGSNTDDRVIIELPYISLQTLKIENVDITTREGATDAIGKMDETLVYLTKERAKISLWASRTSHSASNADIGAYNNTLSDSKVMDTNYGDEMLNLSKAQVLTEFGISSVTEVQKMIENVLKFIS